jgi:hypothetical protein
MPSFEKYMKLAFEEKVRALLDSNQYWVVILYKATATSIQNYINSSLRLAAATGILEPVASSNRKNPRSLSPSELPRANDTYPAEPLINYSRRIAQE